MGHKNKKSLTRQVQEALESKLKTGHSKHEDKRSGIYKDYIYSYSTLRTYMKECNYFVQYCKTNHRCKTLDDCRPYIAEWIDSRRHLSVYTLKLDISAVAKLYGVSAPELGIKTPSRTMDKITRSRGERKMDRHFSEKRNADLITFAKSTGLRRNEMKYIKGTDLQNIDGKWYISVTVGSKGGKPRLAPVIGDVDKVIEMMTAAGENRVFDKIHSAADIHSYRADYASEYYRQIARPINRIPYDRINKGTGKMYQSEVYICRGADKGRRFDKKALLEVSKALGHSRISVAAEHYIRF